MQVTMEILMPESGEFSLQLNITHKQSTQPLSGLRFLPNEEWSLQQIKSQIAM
jgi:hypothetical protein